jgi:hypothetical protein
LTTRITGRCAASAGLRERPLGGVDKQQHTVDHREAALDLAAEVRVAGGVDDVDHRHGAVGVLAVHRGVLRQDRDALFLLQVTGVHQAFDGVVAAMVQGTRLAQHGVDEGRLPMVDVCHDRDVPKIHAGDSPSVVGQTRKRETPVTCGTARDHSAANVPYRSKFRPFFARYGTFGDHPPHSQSPGVASNSPVNSR